MLNAGMNKNFINIPFDVVNQVARKCWTQRNLQNLLNNPPLIFSSGNSDLFLHQQNLLTRVEGH